MSNWSITWVFLCNCKCAYNHDLIPDISVRRRVCECMCLRCKMVEREFEINMLCWSAILGKRTHTHIFYGVHHLFAPHSSDWMNDCTSEATNDWSQRSLFAVQSMLDNKISGWNAYRTQQTMSINVPIGPISTAKHTTPFSEIESERKRIFCILKWNSAVKCLLPLSLESNLPL